MTIRSLIRSDLKDFQPYASARSLYTKGTFMDANENSLGSTVELPLEQELNRYPDPYSTELREALAKFAGVKTENIFTGNGSDEAIDLLIRLFVERDEEILIVEPTYGMYRVAAALADVKVATFMLSVDFALDVEALLAAVSPKTKMLFLCSPNNPTGKLVEPAVLERICGNFSGIVILDEAYIEFASASSSVEKIKNFENLVVLRTFSKAWGLAGIRVGYAVAGKEVIEYLNKIKPPYNLNRVSARIALEALKQSAKMAAFKDIILKERARLAESLAKLGFEVFPSEANFILARRVGASTLTKKLAEGQGIIIREFASQPLLKDCVRISVGTAEENTALLEALTKIV